MKQAVTGVSPPSLAETTIMTVWPSIAAWPIGQCIGQLCSNRAGLNKYLTIGKLFALLSIPLALPLFFARLAPPIPFTWPYNKRYRLTNRRVIVLADRIQWKLTVLWGFIVLPLSFERGMVLRSVDLDQFDQIDVEVLPGQGWYPAGELIFRKGNVETFRLSGVQHPEAFRQTLLKAQISHVGVKQALARQLAHA